MLDPVAASRSRISDKNILVTGGCGFIGSHLVSALSDIATVRVVDNLSKGSLTNLKKTKKITFVKKDIRTSLNRVIRDVNLVFHLAAATSARESVNLPTHYAETNVMGTINLLEACRRYDIERIVFTSSAAIYGQRTASNNSSREIQEPDPGTPYALGKLVCERYMQLYHELYGLRTTSLRLFNVYGPGQRSGSDYASVIPAFVSRALSGLPIIVNADGRQTRDFIHIDDVVQALTLASWKNAASGMILNVGSGKSTSINELAQIVKNLVGKVEIRHAEARAGEVRFSRADISITQKILGFKPSVKLQDGLRTVIRSTTKI